MTRPIRWLLTALLVAAPATGCSTVLGTDELTFDSPPECEETEDCADARVECETLDSCRLCRGETCSPLQNGQLGSLDETGDCKLVLGAQDLKPGSKTFLFGALTAIGSSDAPAPVTLSYELAIREFASKGGVRIQGEDRHAVVVLCDATNVTSERLDRTFDHLTQTLGISAIIAPLPAAELKRSFERLYQRGQRVFFLSPFESDSLLTNVEDEGLLWHLLSNSTEVARAYVPLLRRAERYVQTTTDDADGSALRLALVDSNLSSESDMASLVHTEAHFNGKPLRETAGATYLRVRLESAETDPGASVTESFLALARFRPHVVVATGGVEFLRRIWHPLEQALHGLSDDGPLPFYVLSPYHVIDPSALYTPMEMIPSLQARVIGVNAAAAPDRTLYNEYLGLLEASNPNTSGLAGTENFYDSIYFLLYAATAAGNVPRLTGLQIARGMLELLRGPNAKVGAAAIPDVRAMLAANGSVTLEGTLGLPDFDEGTGARKGVGSVWCVEHTDEGLGLQLDVLRYDPQTQELTGSFPCFSGF